MTDRSFRELARRSRPSLAGELWRLLREHKKWWLAPIVLAILALYLLASAGSGAAPFIYTLF